MIDKSSGNLVDGLHKLKDILLADYYKRKEQYDQDSSDAEEPSTRSGISSLEVAAIGYDSDERKNHHTEKYELMDGNIPTPIYRRGEPFSLHLNFNRQYNPELDIIYVILSYGPSASISNGTKYKIPVSKLVDGNIEQWAVLLEENNGNIVKLKVYSPVKSQVGLWRFQIATSLRSNSYENIDRENIFYMLFNPWCRDDEVYMDDEVERLEYVLCDEAYIFTGTYKNITSLRWVYGQFDYVVLPSTILLLEQSDLPHSERGSAIHVARALSALVNNLDDMGLLEGKWGPHDGRYTDGTAPESWTGSTAIFEQFLKNSGKTVKYAQCWVFAGCLTTACRALGIPCRTITCFNSAHDTDGTLTIDQYKDRSGRDISREVVRVADSMWNYHCWNEVWLARADLPSGYDGWQAIDATPQEQSRGTYRMGPTPLRAIKEGELGLNYDVPFVFAEVNADICHLIENPSSPWGFSLVNVDKRTTGKQLVTQNFKHETADKIYMEDVTLEYKYPEGSDKEREVFYKALRQAPKALKFYENFTPVPVPKDVEFSFQEITSLLFGQPFDMAVTIQNDSDEVRSVQTSLTATAVDYTGGSGTTVRSGEVNITLQPKEKKVVKMEVTEEDYRGKMNHTPHIKMAAVCVVKETFQLYTDEDVFEIINSPLVIKAPHSSVSLGNVFEIEISFKNPYKEVLTNCSLNIEGPGVARPKLIPLDDIPPEGTMVRSVKLKPRRIGPCMLVCILHSEELTNVQGSITFNVTE